MCAGRSGWSIRRDGGPSRRKKSRQRERGGGTGNIGTASAGAPRGGHSPSCPAWTFHTEHRPALSKGTGTRKKRLCGTERFSRNKRSGQTVQALARQTKSASGYSMALRRRITPDMRVRPFEFPRLAHWPRPFQPIRK